MLMVALVMGILTFTATVILIEKLPAWIRELVYGHHLLSDLLFTIVSLSVFPVTGAATLISSALYCLLISAYLSVNRKTKPWSRVVIKPPFKWKIERGNRGIKALR